MPKTPQVALPEGVEQYSNMVATSWTWKVPGGSVPDTGTTVQLVWTHGTDFITMHMRPDGQTRWMSFGKIDRERWAFDGTLNGARDTAVRFYLEG